jgi:hypothetical protein
MVRQAIAFSLLGVLASLGSTARADVVERGFVVFIEDGEIFFDIGAEAGLAEGNAVRIKHPLRLKNPVTGDAVVDELPVGALRVAQVRARLSMAKLEGDLDGRVVVGDVIEVLIPDRDPDPEPEPEQQPDEAPPELEPLPVVDGETSAALAVWRDTAGKRVDVRIAAWQRYLERNPESAFRAQVEDELVILREYHDKFPPEAAMREPRVSGVAHSAPTRASHGVAIPLAFAIERPEQVVTAWIHYRRAGDETYRRTDLHRDGDAYLRANLPEEAVRAPGIEYFVEVATHAGNVGTAVGTAAAPMRVEVEAPPRTELFVERRNRSRVTLRSSYMSFDTFDDRDPEGGDRTDEFWQFEADFFLRLYRRVYGIRTGFGVINGKGGLADATDPEPAGFNYGYTELEFRATDAVSFMSRLTAGLGREGLGFGVEGRLRAGREDATNITFAASTLEEIGWLTEIRMQWAVVPHFPVGLAVGATDRPNRGDVGVRLSADIGWSAIDWVQPTLRLSYQGRTVEHSGVGAGLGLVFDW